MGVQTLLEMCLHNVWMTPKTNWTKILTVPKMLMRTLGKNSVRFDEKKFKVKRKFKP